MSLQWHDECRAMRKRSPRLSIQQIANLFDKNQSTVRWVLDEREEKAAKKLRARKK